MNGALDGLTWPLARLGEGIELLARRAGLPPIQEGTLHAPASLVADGPEGLARWIDWACDRIGLEAEAVEESASDCGRFLRHAGPAVLRLDSGGGEAGFLLLLGPPGGRLRLLGPDLRVHRQTVESVRGALCTKHEMPVLPEIEELLDAAEVPRLRRNRARRAILRERLSAARIEGCWLVRLPPTVAFGRNLRFHRLPARIAWMLGLFTLVYALEIVSWSVIGEGALQGRIDYGLLLVWTLLVLSMIPLQLMSGWMEATFALGAGRLLKQRLLAGALRMDLEGVRRQGAGQLLGQVLESQALESLAVNGGLMVLVALLEALFAGWILATGAGGLWHLLLFLVWLGVTVALCLRYFRRLHRWTGNRLGMTQDLVERMVGHRTCLAQESAVRRDAFEDQALASFLGASSAMDASFAPLVALLPRGWLVLGLAGLAPAFITGSSTSVGLAIGLGGTLLAGRALGGISGGLAALARAGIAWTQIAPLFRAAHREPPTNPFLAAVQLAPAAADGPATNIVIDGSDISFRYTPTGRDVLKGAEISIRRGDRVLLEGPSGGGKSTLASLMVGLRVPQSGLLLLNGLDRHTLGDDWHRLANAAPQYHENHVFSGTLAFNLLMGRRWPPTLEDLDEARDLCTELGLGGLLSRMPADLMQMVGETGWQLSHGERSRIFLARALLQNPHVTVLDESFAALDPETMAQCLACALRRAHTLVVIAHP